MTDVVMPQMGESIVEGTLTKWLKKPGEHVERDEPLFEISTDKVDTEIPSPAGFSVASSREQVVAARPPFAPLVALALRDVAPSRLRRGRRGQ